MRDPFSNLPHSKGQNVRPRSRYRREFSAENFAATTSRNLPSRPHGERFKLLFIAAIVMLFLLLGRTGSLQIAKGTSYRELAEGHRIKIEVIKASRGVITDRNGTTLLSNVPSYRLIVTPYELPAVGTNERNSIIAIASRVSGLSPESLEQKITNHKKTDPLVIRENIPPNEALTMIVETEEHTGVRVDIAPNRSYKFADAFAHLIGYVGAPTEDDLERSPEIPSDDVIGKTGLEAVYDKRLRGTNGIKEIERDAKGKEQKLIASRDPVPGQNLELAIDEKLQREATSLLNRMIRERRSPGGALIALDPRTGEVLTLVSAPGYDPNAFVRGLSPSDFEKLLRDPSRPLFNRAISGEYPSGSTIKPVIAAAALQERVITPTTTVMSTGGFSIDRWFFPDWKPGGHGLTDVRKAIAESVNTFFYLAGGGDDTRTGLGVDRIRSYAERFGLNETLGIDLPAESSGFLPTKEWKEETKGEPWYIGDTYHLAIGQGDLLVTPLQVASYTAAIANGGTLYQPHILKAVLDATGKPLERTTPTVIRSNIVDESFLRIVREGLREVITTGSGRALADFPISVAGKTGTAQFGSEGRTHAWFTAFAPFENPEIAVTVLIEGGGEGHESALPVAKDYLRTWLQTRTSSQSEKMTENDV